MHSHVGACVCCLFGGFGVGVECTPGRYSAEGRACACDRWQQVVVGCCVGVVSLGPSFLLEPSAFTQYGYRVAQIHRGGLTFAILAQAVRLEHIRYSIR